MLLDWEDIIMMICGRLIALAGKGRR